jgi:hypothetical protein
MPRPSAATIAAAESNGAVEKAKATRTTAAPKPGAKTKAVTKGSTSKATKAQKQNGATQSAETESNEVQVPEVKDIAPKSFKSMLVPLDNIKGWEGGDPPASDFIADVRRYGIENPIRVVLQDGVYYAVDGRRRLKTADHLRQNGVEGFGQVPVVIDTRKGREPGLSSLAMNYQRGENYTGDARTVKGYIDQGWTEKQIAAESGLKVEQVRALRDVATKLDSRLIAAIERGQMSPWSAKHAARLKAPEQEKLVKILMKKGKVAPDDVVQVRNAVRTKAIENFDTSMFSQGGDLPFDESYDDGDEDEDGTDPVSHATNVANGSAGQPGYEKPQRGKITAAQRKENLQRLVMLAQHEIENVATKDRTQVEAQILLLTSEILNLLHSAAEFTMEPEGESDGGVDANPEPTGEDPGDDPVEVDADGIPNDFNADEDEPDEFDDEEEEEEEEDENEPPF